MTKKRSRKQLQAIHAKNPKNFVPISVLQKNPKNNEIKVEIFFKDKPMTQSDAFHEAAVKSGRELEKSKYKIGAKRYAIALPKKDLGALKKGKDFDRPTKATAFLISKKVRGGEQLVARNGPKNEKPEIILGERRK